MMNYLLPLLALVLLCAFWALFQRWLSEADPAVAVAAVATATPKSAAAENPTRGRVPGHADPAVSSPGDRAGLPAPAGLRTTA